jgi:hypothetical protein
MLWSAAVRRNGFAVANLTLLFVFRSFDVAKALRDFHVFRGLKKRSSRGRTPKTSV